MGSIASNKLRKVLLYCCSPQPRACTSPASPGSPPLPPLSSPFLPPVLLTSQPGPTACACRLARRPALCSLDQAASSTCLPLIPRPWASSSPSWGARPGHARCSTCRYRARTAAAGQCARWWVPPLPLPPLVGWLGCTPHTPALHVWCWLPRVMPAWLGVRAGPASAHDVHHRRRRECHLCVLPSGASSAGGGAAQGELGARARQHGPCAPRCPVQGLPCS